jgi:hypothetical protein
MLEVSSALKSDCNGLFGFTASTGPAPAVAVRLTGTDDMSDDRRRVGPAIGRVEGGRWMIKDGLDYEEECSREQGRVENISTGFA